MYEDDNCPKCFLAKGIASLVGGQLLSAGWTIPDVFLLYCTVCGSLTIVVLLSYHLYFKKFEAQLIREKEELLAKMAQMSQTGKDRKASVKSGDKGSNDLGLVNPSFEEERSTAEEDRIHEEALGEVVRRHSIGSNFL